MKSSIAQVSPCAMTDLSVGTCLGCCFNKTCLPKAMDIDHFFNVVKKPVLIPLGEYLYKENDKFNSLFVLRSGSMKETIVTDNGDVQVVELYFPGEMIGLNGIGFKYHTTNIITLENSEICEIPFQHLEGLALNTPALQHYLFQLLSRKIESNHRMMLTLNGKNAESKIAIFLLNLSKRLGRRNLTKSHLHLPMSRMDIGNFMGLTIETVSRSLQSLHKKGIINVSGREVSIHNLKKLELMCCSSD